MIPVKAGELNRKVTLYDVPAETQDAYGQVSDTAAEIGTFRAKVENLRGRELQSAQQMFASVSHKVTMRWLGSAIPASDHNPYRLILPRMYLVLDLDGTRLDVVSADNVGKANLYWVLTCNEKVVT